MIKRNYTIQINPEVKCLTPCPVVPGRFVASGNCRTACKHFRSMVNNNWGFLFGEIRGYVLCASDEIPEKELE